MRLRWLAAVAVCALGALTLTGCDSKIGAAAVVNGSKISESDVSRYLDLSADKASEGRALTLQSLIREKLFTVALRAKNALPSDTDLAKLHDTAISDLIGQQVTGSLADQTLQTAIEQAGLKASFVPVLTRSFELELTYANVTKAQAESAVATDLAKQKIPVTVNPRFGSWDTATFSFKQLGKQQLPSVVTLGNALPGDAQPTPAPSQ